MAALDPQALLRRQARFQAGERTPIHVDKWMNWVTETGVLRLLTWLDLSQGVRELAPAAIAAAAHGDRAPLARLTRALQPETPGSGLQASISSAPHEPPSPSASLAEGSLAAEAPLIDSVISIALFAATYCVENELPWS